jgi:hypothetical protein
MVVGVFTVYGEILLRVQCGVFVCIVNNVLLQFGGEGVLPSCDSALVWYIDNVPVHISLALASASETLAATKNIIESGQGCNDSIDYTDVYIHISKMIPHCTTSG